MFIASRFNSTCAPLGALCIAVFNYMPLLTERNNKLMQALSAPAYHNQGRRASLCSALAPGFHIPPFGTAVPLAQSQ